MFTFPVNKELVMKTKTIKKLVTRIRRISNNGIVSQYVQSLLFVVVVFVVVFCVLLLLFFGLSY